MHSELMDSLECITRALQKATENHSLKKIKVCLLIIIRRVRHTPWLVWR